MMAFLLLCSARLCTGGIRFVSAGWIPLNYSHCEFTSVCQHVENEIWALYFYCWRWEWERERVLYVMAYANTVNVRETVKIRDEDEVAEVEDWAGGRSSSYSNSSWSDGDVTRVFNGTENQQQTAIRKDANRISAKDKIHSSVSCFNIPFHSTLCVRL